MQSKNLHKLEALVRAGNLPGAIKQCQAVCRRAPRDSQAWMFLATLFVQNKDAVPAMEAFRKVVSLDPANFQACYNLGVLHRQSGHMQQSVQTFRQALRIQPDNVQVLMALALSLCDGGNISEAENILMQAINRMPESVELIFQLAIILMRCKKAGEAEQHFRKVIALKPDMLDAYNNLGLVLSMQRRCAEAEQQFLHVLSLSQDHPSARLNLGDSLARRGRHSEATECYQKIGHDDPLYSRAQNNLGVMYMDKAELDQAETAFRRSAERNPAYSDPYNNMGYLLEARGCYQQAMNCFRKAMTLDPDSVGAHSNLLYLMNFSLEFSEQEKFSESLEWGEKHARRNNSVPVFENSCKSGRQLKIGYVSPDLRRHSVASFIEPVLEAYDRSEFEVYCYASVENPDETTETLRHLSCHWRDIFGLSDDDVASRIRGDSIDILVDLAGHTAGSRLKVFARKPAPVCITYLGYPNTTGMEVMDYRLTDVIADPEPASDKWYVERLLRIPNGFLCYKPVKNCPPVKDIRIHRDGGVTFGCFNNSKKITLETLSMWADILRKSIKSRLLLKSRWYADNKVRQRIIDFMEENGICGSRLEFCGYVKDDVEHLKLYDRVHIALDTYPYHGTTTTCEALWMGVPVITLAGGCHAARVGASIMQSAGLAELVARSCDEYVAMAISLSADRETLSGYRKTLRGRMAESDLTDKESFVRRLENAYRSAWESWCQRS